MAELCYRFHVVRPAWLISEREIVKGRGAKCVIVLGTKSVEAKLTGWLLVEEPIGRSRSVLRHKSPQLTLALEMNDGGLIVYCRGEHNEPMGNT